MQWMSLRCLTIMMCTSQRRVEQRFLNRRRVVEIYSNTGQEGFGIIGNYFSAVAPSTLSYLLFGMRMYYFMAQLI